MHLFIGLRRDLAHWLAAVCLCLMALLPAFAAAEQTIVATVDGGSGPISVPLGGEITMLVTGLTPNESFKMYHYLLSDPNCEQSFSEPSIMWASPSGTWERVESYYSRQTVRYRVEQNGIMSNCVTMIWYEEAPTEIPTNVPTDPTETPTDVPTDPTETPTDVPTDPTETPTDVPTDPTETPTDVPTDPTEIPTEVPTTPTGNVNAGPVRALPVTGSGEGRRDVMLTVLLTSSLLLVIVTGLRTHILRED